MQAYELRLWRKQMGWQQEQAAQALDMSLRTYKRYETGERLKVGTTIRKSQPIPDIVRRATQHISLQAMLHELPSMSKEQLIRQLSALLKDE